MLSMLRFFLAEHSRKGILFCLARAKPSSKLTFLLYNARELLFLFVTLIAHQDEQQLLVTVGLCLFYPSLYVGETLSATDVVADDSAYSILVVATSNRSEALLTSLYQQ